MNSNHKPDKPYAHYVQLFVGKWEHRCYIYDLFRPWKITHSKHSSHEGYWFMFNPKNKTLKTNHIKTETRSYTLTQDDIDCLKLLNDEAQRLYVLSLGCPSDTDSTSTVH